MKALIALLSTALLLAGCSWTDYYPYHGGGPLIGQGGAAKRIEGVDIWLTGSPPRKFQIIGYVEDTRSGKMLAMSTRDRRLAEKAKLYGGDGVLIQSDTVTNMGSVSSGNAFTSLNGAAYGNTFYGSALTTGTSITTSIIWREGRFFVIKYL